ncbi:MAG: ABC transporter permease subunit [Spirochaetaceae bacterium]
MKNLRKINKLGMLKQNWQLYVLVLLPLIFIIIFNYVPIYGAQIAFRRFSARAGILDSNWVGLKYFIKFFQSPMFKITMLNTIKLSIIEMALTFPLPIILSIFLHYMMKLKYKSVVQMITYAPYFISEVVVVSILFELLSTRTGAINNLIRMFGAEPINFLGNPEYFRMVYSVSSVWQIVGFSSIVYLSALSSVSPSLHDSATIDGANKLQRILYIDLPSIMPMIMIMLILRVGYFMNVSFTKALLLQNPLNISSSEILWTYTYKIGFANGSPQFSYASAIGLVANIINFTLLLLVNYASKKTSKVSLF